MNAAKVARKIFLLVSVVVGKKDYRVRDRGCEDGGLLREVSGMEDMGVVRILERLSIWLMVETDDRERMAVALGKLYAKAG